MLVDVIEASKTSRGAASGAKDDKKYVTLARNSGHHPCEEYIGKYICDSLASLLINFYIVLPASLVVTLYSGHSGNL